MIRFIFNRAFQLGFWVAMVSFVVFNLMTFTYKSESRVRNELNGAGFPLDFYQYGGNPYVEKILTFGLIFDLAVAFVYSFVIGSVLSFLWMKDLQKTREAMTGKL